MTAVRLLPILASSGAAQTPAHGSIRGRILDPKGLPVPAASVPLPNAATGAEWKGSSDGGGSYQFPRAAPGRYSLTAEKIQLGLMLAF